MKLARLGEFGLIDRIHRIVGEKPEGVVLGIGDDAAVFRGRPGWLTVLTTDAMVEGVHFDLRYTPMESLGWKALAINISDIAAVGGAPKYAVVSLALPENWETEDIDSFYRGMVRCSKVYGCTLVGGDVVRSEEEFFLSVSVVGEVEEDYVVSRGGAKEGDLLCVTGELGGSMVGLEILSSDGNINNFTHSVNRFLEPKVRLQEAVWLAKELGVSSMIDISDGLSSEIGHLCRQSDLGCLIWSEKIPVAEETVRWSAEKNKPFLRYAIESGEEYELLFTVDKTEYEEWKKENPDYEGLKVSIIGEMTREEDGIRMKTGEETCLLYSTGWNHFKI